MEVIILTGDGGEFLGRWKVDVCFETAFTKIATSSIGFEIILTRCKSAQSVEKLVCQMCDEVGHSAIVCPWVHSRCRHPFCNGIRKLRMSTKSISAGEKFFSCQHPHCKYFGWFDARLSASVGSSSTTGLHSNGCWGCGDLTHFMNKCPWNNIPCTKARCSGVKWLHISNNLHNNGIPYTMCNECGDFFMDVGCPRIEHQGQRKE